MTDPEPELIDFYTQDNPKARLKLSDGSTMEIKFAVAGVTRVGVDPSTGLPAYVIQTQAFPRLIEVPPDLRVRPRDEKVGLA